jgi:hypothetical protein
MEDAKICCGFFRAGLWSPDRRQYSEKSGSNFTNNIGGTLLLGHGGPQPVIYATDINIIRLQEN